MEQTSIEEGARVDARGRVRISAERRAALLAEFALSRLSGQAFAAQAGINYQTFATWVQQQRSAEATRAVTWVEAQLPTVLPASPVIVYLPSGIRVETAEVRQAVELLRGLGAAAC